MAQDQLKQQLRELMKCKVCLEEKEHQKQLPCQHTLCLGCLDKLEITEASYSCPLCDKSHPALNGGFQALPDSLSTKDLAEVLKTSEPMAQSQPASAKSDEKKEPVCKEKAEELKQEKMLKELKETQEKVSDALKLAETKIGARVKLERTLTQDADEMKSKLTDMMEEAIAKLRASVAVKVKAIDEVKQQKLENNSAKKSKLSETSERLSTVVAELEAKATQVEDSNGQLDISEDLKVVRAALKDVKMQLKDSGKEKLKKGDSVRLKMKLSELDEDFMKNPLNHSNIGYILKIDHDDKKCSVLFADYSKWTGDTALLEKSPWVHRLPVTGDKVRVKASVETPFYKWRKVSYQSVGTLTYISSESSTAGRKIKVAFPENREWDGLFEEVEKCPADVGDKVRVVEGITDPSGGWQGATSDSAGTLVSVAGDQVVVQFPKCHRWKGLLSEVEPLPTIQVGYKVRVKKSVKNPVGGWAGVTHNDEGIVVAIMDAVAVVNFPSRMGIHWQALVHELEVVDRSPDVTGEPVNLQLGGMNPQALQQQFMQLQQMMQTQNQ